MLIVTVSHVEGNIADQITPFDLPSVREYSATDHAWSLGFSAATDSLDFEDVFPPAELTVAEARAFRAGAREGFKALEWEIEQSRTPMCDEDADDMYDSWIREREARDAFLGHSSDETY